METTTTTVSQEFSITELLGAKLLSPGSNIADYDSNNLQNKTIALFFSNWNDISARDFALKLADAYKQLNDDMKTKFDIVLLSNDDSEDNYNLMRESLPWTAVPFDKEGLQKKLKDQYDGAQLVILKPDGQLVTANGKDDYLTAETFVAPGNSKAIESWIKGKPFCWTRAPKDENEYVWKGWTCVKCFMKPIVGERYAFVSEEHLSAAESRSLCEKCFEELDDYIKPKLIKWLISNRHYSITELLGNGEVLVNHNGDRISIADFIKDKKLIGLYFSPDNDEGRAFRDKLIQIYNQVLESATNNGPSFDIIVIWRKYTIEDDVFYDSYEEMPWKAVPFPPSDMDVAIRHNLMTYFEILGWNSFNKPSLVVLKSDGEIQTTAGAGMIQHYGFTAVEMWMQGENPKHIWEVVCDVCHITPVVGVRYYCNTCGNYDLCEECEQKGHEHDLLKFNTPADVRQARDRGDYNAPY